MFGVFFLIMGTFREYLRSNINLPFQKRLCNLCFFNKILTHLERLIYKSVYYFIIYTFTCYTYIAFIWTSTSYFLSLCLSVSLTIVSQLFLFSVNALWFCHFLFLSILNITLPSSIQTYHIVSLIPFLSFLFFFFYDRFICLFTQRLYFFHTDQHVTFFLVVVSITLSSSFLSLFHFHC